MKAFLVALAVGTLVRAATAQQTVPADFPPEFQAWYEPAEPLRIVGPIHYVGTQDLAVFLIQTPEGHILIDGAMPPSAELIEASIRKLGLKPEDIRFLLITQAHVDHVGTVAHFKKVSGASLAVTAGDVDVLKSGGKTDYLFAQKRSFHFPPAVADRILKDGDIVTLGGVKLTAHHTPGHTPGCTTWTTTVEDGGRAYSVIFTGSTSVNPGTRLVRDPSYPGIADDYRRSFALLESLKPEIFLAAHASFFDLTAKRPRAVTEGARAFVDPDGYRRQLATQRAKFDALVTKENTPAPN